MQNSSALSSDFISAAHGVAQECADCGMMNLLSPPIAGTDICCSRCDTVLRRVKGKTLQTGLAWTLAAGFFYLLTILAPMMQVYVFGEMRSGKIETGPITLDDQGFWALASIVFLTTILMPCLKIIGTLIVLTTAINHQTSRAVAQLYAFVRHINPWVMIEVYLLGFVVAYSRLQVIAHVHLAVAITGLVGLMLSILAMDATIDPETIWERIRPRQTVDPHAPHQNLTGCDTCFQVSAMPAGAPCPRCGDILHDRKPNSLGRAWALMIAAAILYVPSNLYPIMHVTQLSRQQSYTIFGGLKELAKVGLWPLAVLVFCASIAIPVFKLVVLSVMLIQTHNASPSQLHNRTRLYRVIDFIGRWSMVDVFVVSILVALVHFGWLTQITADWGAIYFAAVVVLTMLAVKYFDPRLMWDAAASQTSFSRHPRFDDRPAHE